MNATVAIGRNVGAAPMPDTRWQAFQTDTVEAIKGCGGKVLATIEGASKSEEWGEELAAWIACDLSAADTARLRSILSDLSAAYQQDAIALTIGITELVEPTAAQHAA